VKGEGRGIRGASAHLAPVHAALPVVARERFEPPLATHRLVNFLNRALKRRGLVFGLTRESGAEVITVYDASGGGMGGADGRHDGGAP
jgi:hypothetical protein